MGDASKGSQRLSLAGGINNLGTTIGPLVVSFAIFGQLGNALKLSDIGAVKFPYLILGAAFLVVAIIFKFSKLPNQVFAEDAKDTSENQRSSAINYPQLSLGMIAIFLYVGVEVSTASNLPEYMLQYCNIQTSQAAPYISLFWASLMIGRWNGSAGAFTESRQLKNVLRFIMPYLAFAVFLLVNALANSDIAVFYPYGLVILIMILADLLSQGNPAKQLMIFSFCAIAALIIGMLSSGLLSVYAFISVGLFCSTLWPCIFTLAIAGLGKFTNQGSSYLIMMIMGGGLVSWLQGWLSGSDMLGIKYSYLVGVVCFLYLAFYGWKVKSILKAQAIDLTPTQTSGH